MELTLDHLYSKWMLFRGSTLMRVSSFLRSCTKYLLNNLPFDNQIIKYAKFFQPSLQQSIAAPNALSGLTLSIAQVLGTDEMSRYFKLGSTAAKFDLCDVVKKEFREYQTWKGRQERWRKPWKEKKATIFELEVCLWLVRHRAYNR